MNVEVIVLTSGQTVDLITAGDDTPEAVALLLHGSGTSERLALRSLARVLADRGIASVVLDWHPADEAGSVPPVLSYTESALQALGLGSERCVVVGYSAGCRPALRSVLAHESRVSRCVLIATPSIDTVSGSGRRTDLQDVRVRLVHGDADTVRSPDVSKQLRGQLERLGVCVDVAIIEGAGHDDVACMTFDPWLQLSNPTGTLSDTMLDAATSIVDFILAAGKP